MARQPDKELETYRGLLDTPTEFRDGFGWATVVGIFFCGLIMLPGSIYLGLMTGGSLGSAASWVTVILFAQVARRAMKAMTRQELVVLLHAARIMIAGAVLFPGGPFGHLVYRAFLVTSEAARDAGMTHSFPAWFVPSPESEAVMERNFFHADWLAPVGVVAFMTITGFIRRYTLGYFFFRVTSDIEKLPFPMAPISAQGVMALAEMEERDKKKTNKWRLFSLGAVLGISFGALQVGVPAVTGLFLDKPVYLIPQPFLDTTTWTEAILPATPTGVAIDLGIILMGMVLPFYAVLGTFTAIGLTVLLNPLLHHAGVLTHWQPGMNTINTAFANNIDFWMSFGIGTGLGIAVVSIFSTVRDVVRIARKQHDQRTAPDSPKPQTGKEGRGDYPMWLAAAAYAVSSLAVIFLCHTLVPQIPLAFLFVFSFVYNPFISYVNARLLGMAGQQVDIPFVREGAFILSGAKGLDIWLAPIPIENYGQMTQSFRVNELTGVSFWSLIKAELVAIPILFLLSGLFWAFIWRSGAIPSDAYPYAQVQWEYMSKNNVLLYSSTFVAPGEDPESKSLADSQFMKAIHPKTIGVGAGFTIITFAVLNILGLPVMLIYGFVRGVGQFPHILLLEIVGALLGRYYFQKKFGRSEFLRMVPAVMAGYFTGVGLISMATIALTLIKNAVSGAPF